MALSKCLKRKINCNENVSRRIGCTLATVFNIFAFVVSLVMIGFGLLLTAAFNAIYKTPSMREELQKFINLLKSQGNDHFDEDKLILSMQLQYLMPGIILILLGVALVTVCCIGFHGIRTENVTCLIIYAFGIGIFLICQVSLNIIWYADSTKIKLLIKQAMEGRLAHYEGLNSTNVESLLQDMLHHGFECCGVNNGSDFLNRVWNRRFILSNNQSGETVIYNLTYPATCCVFDRQTLQPSDPLCLLGSGDLQHNSNVHVGCYDQFFNDSMERGFNYVFEFMSGMAAVELVLEVLTIAKIIAIRKRGSKVAP